MIDRKRQPVLMRPIWLVLTIAVLSLGTALWTLSPGWLGFERLSALLAFLGTALTPAMTYQADFVPVGTEPLLLKALKAAWHTVLFAGAGLGIALLAGIPLGFVCSTSIWRGVRSRPFLLPFVAIIYLLGRILITFSRSVHELLWAVLFLAAFGLTKSGAVLAIAIPYAGVFAKVFSDLIDECPSGVSDALHASGATSVQSFIFGRLPQAVPDMAAYTMYRFECAVRSSAVLGFFGIPTLGYYISASFENLYYAEVWTYLYVLFALVVLLDIWSRILRQGLAQ